MENCGHSKPNAAYWHHVATVMKVDPEYVVAVANGCTQDMSARLVGIKTYLVTDYVIGDAASSGADHILDVLAYFRRSP
ncbi:hypothetical protein [Candidatus Cryosericum septentrionale]|jgi:FMN phosphatase YigB (HAD superfamily)|uniref:hypothetical protein n=1 Tax=Candidatus Cryosericum septentrionale TaxID=2290913 RepID=UPI000F87D92C|nr:hypothetical protein [Candidatus Cryosericum septentrionale]